MKKRSVRLQGQLTIPQSIEQILPLLPSVCLLQPLFSPPPPAPPLARWRPNRVAARQWEIRDEMFADRVIASGFATKVAANRYIEAERIKALLMSDFLGKVARPQ